MPPLRALMPPARDQVHSGMDWHCIRGIRAGSARAAASALPPTANPFRDSFRRARIGARSLRTRSASRDGAPAFACKSATPRRHHLRVPTAPRYQPCGKSPIIHRAWVDRETIAIRATYYVTYFAKLCGWRRRREQFMSV